MAANNIILPESVLADIVTATGAAAVSVVDTVQELWSGYGSIVRLQLTGGSVDTAILKLIEPPQKTQHPRGWNTNDSHQRKLRSYQVETRWYERYAAQCGADCKVPFAIATGYSAAQQWILMEDLSATHPRRAATLTLSQAQVCLRWLAAFHAKFLNHEPAGLWPIGTYWHLDTRQEEWQSMPDGRLKESAADLDNKLNGCEFQCIVHGDAKVANFCFTERLDSVVAVDFQYVGGGAGIKDVAYFLGSCLDETIIKQHESALLSCYFHTLTEAIAHKEGQQVAERVEREWSALYSIAWTDFYRFLEGWMPGHKKINRYTKQLASQAFDQL